MSNNIYEENRDMQKLNITILPEFGEAYEISFLVEDTDNGDIMQENINTWIEDNLINVQAWEFTK